MKVKCDLEETELDGDPGLGHTGVFIERIEGVRATCSRCGHQTESYGTEDASRRRCLVLMREECPNAGESNFYVDADD